MIGNTLRTSVRWIGRTSFDLLLKTGATANQVSWVGLVLVLCNCAAYWFHQDTFFLGLGLALAYALDGLDGALARRTGTTSRFGSYLDAVIDRYQEIASYLVLGLVNGWWLPVYLLTTGAMLVSYNKAAVALEAPIKNKDWPDLMERPVRAWLFCGGLITDNAIYVPEELGGQFILVVLWILAALTHFTAFNGLFGPVDDWFPSPSLTYGKSFSRLRQVASAISPGMAFARRFQTSPIQGSF